MNSPQRKSEVYYKEKYEKIEKSLDSFVDIVLICIVPLILILAFRNI